MIQLQWVVPEHTSTERPRLQYRMHGGPGLGTWSDWLDVPTVVDPVAKPPASGALLSWIINNLLTESQLGVTPPGQSKALRFLAPDVKGPEHG